VNPPNAAGGDRLPSNLAAGQAAWSLLGSPVSRTRQTRPVDEPIGKALEGPGRGGSLLDAQWPAESWRTSYTLRTQPT